MSSFDDLAEATLTLRDQRRVCKLGNIRHGADYSRATPPLQNRCDNETPLALAMWLNHNNARIP